ncbi:MAG: hypothetical protein K6E30_06465 [Lachnospiraceae bacterium]|nr:hypothetical protein [Lachnospiraceae bacterium]
MRNRLIRLAVLCSAALCLIGCGLRDAAEEKLGGSLLLEKRASGYYSIFAPQNAVSFEIPEELPGTFSKNLILSPKQYLSHDGFLSSVRADGTIVVSGVNEEKDVHLLAADSLLLPAGHYVLTNGGSSLNGKGYILRVVGDDQLMASLPDRSSFTLEKETELSVFILVKKGELLVDEPVRPEICLSENEDVSYDMRPAAKSGIAEGERRALLFKAKKEELFKLDNKERILFERNLDFMYKDRFLWVSILFEDGTGIQIPEGDPKRAIYGPMDIFGQVFK